MNKSLLLRGNRAKVFVERLIQNENSYSVEGFVVEKVLNTQTFKSELISHGFTKFNFPRFIEGQEIELDIESIRFIEVSINANDTTNIAQFLQSYETHDGKVVSINDIVEYENSKFKFADF